jgi:hypothetical protein
MFRAIITRIKQGHRTMPYPAAPLQMPERFRGYPIVSTLSRTDEQGDETSACPYGAFTATGGGCLDMGKCLFCAECPGQYSIQRTTTRSHHRDHLLVRRVGTPPCCRFPDLRQLFETAR